MSYVRRDTERGQGAVETALVLPLVFLLIMGMLELGLAFNAYLTLVSAAREGARAGALYVYDSSLNMDMAANDQNRESGISVNTPYTGNIRDTVAASLGILKNTPPSFDKSTDVTITYTTSPSAPKQLDSRKGDLVNVRVVYRYSVLTQLISGLSTITMTAQASARIE